MISVPRAASVGVPGLATWLATGLPIADAVHHGTRRTRSIPKVGREAGSGQTKEVAMPEIRWLRDVDAAMAEGKAAKKPILLDFSAAPM